jgi:hypothetical protein
MPTTDGWTTDTYAAHNEALRQAEARFQEERDRRYTEVNIEKEKALKIKETADLAALQLARDIQIYKDEKANELREQINSERGLYATKDDLQSAIRELNARISPLLGFVAGQTGRQLGGAEQRAETHGNSTLAVSMAVGAVGLLIGLGGLIFAIASNS